jgi:hypothetical protein
MNSTTTPKAPESCLRRRFDVHSRYTGRGDGTHRGAAANPENCARGDDPDQPEEVRQLRRCRVARILQKLGLRDRVQVVIYAYENGLLSPGT